MNPHQPMVGREKCCQRRIGCGTVIEIDIWISNVCAPPNPDIEIAASVIHPTFWTHPVPAKRSVQRCGESETHAHPCGYRRSRWRKPDRKRKMSCVLSG